ncbi:MAG TPA: acyl-CoA dehydrogenase family protein [Gaiellaceae bacterium]|nr:acyl-CoA dehydrogenase family protein [Gaiellaceae bacterium]
MSVWLLDAIPGSGLYTKPPGFPMDFDLTDEQRALRDSIREFARRELNDDVIERDKSGAFSREAWGKCADVGLLGLPVPEEYGGAGAGALTTIVALEALGRACTDSGLIFSVNAQMWACETPIVRFGTEEQKRRWLPGLCDGSLIAAHGMSEPGSGSDAFSLSTTARRDGEAYVLDGSKTFVTNAPESDLFVVFATVDKELGFAGVTAFLVERDTPGLTVGTPLSKMGLRTSPMGELFFSDCRVPAENLLGKPGQGMLVFDSSMAWERSCILASTVGTMERQLERSLDYARERRQFGRPIGSFQAVSHRLVDMRLRLDTARLLLYRLGWLMDRGEPTTLESALVKLYLSECYVRSSLDALQVHGGYGYMTEYELERDVRDAIGSRLYSGTSELQYEVAAKSLGL